MNVPINVIRPKKNSVGMNSFLIVRSVKVLLYNYFPNSRYTIMKIVDLQQNIIL